MNKVKRSLLGTQKVALNISLLHPNENKSSMQGIQESKYSTALQQNSHYTALQVVVEFDCLYCELWLYPAFCVSLLFAAWGNILFKLSKLYTFCLKSIELVQTIWLIIFAFFCSK